MMLKILRERGLKEIVSLDYSRLINLKPGDKVYYRSSVDSHIEPVPIKIVATDKREQHVSIKARLLKWYNGIYENLKADEEILNMVINPNYIAEKRQALDFAEECLPPNIFEIFRPEIFVERKNLRHLDTIL